MFKNYKNLEAIEILDRQRMARSAGIEPPAFGFGGQHSIQLSYERIIKKGIQKIPIIYKNFNLFRSLSHSLVDYE